MRDIPTTYLHADTLLRSARSEANGKPVANNTRLFRRSDDTIALRLHATDVVLYHADGSMTLNTGGWYTVTTKARINEAIAPLVVWSNKGRWMLGRMGQSSEVVPFADGMRVHHEHPLPRDREAERLAEMEDRRNADMRKAVKRFVSGITPERIVEAFDNPGGDCWGCMMVAEDGSYPMGEDCVPEHVREGYFHAHLAYRAIKAKGYRDPGVIMAMVKADAERGKVDRLLTDALSKFLRKSLTVGAVAVA